MQTLLLLFFFCTLTKNYSSTNTKLIMLSSQLIPESFIKYQQQNLKKEKRKKRIKKNLHGKPPRASESKSCPPLSYAKMMMNGGQSKKPKETETQKNKNTKNKGRNRGKERSCLLVGCQQIQGESLVNELF